MTEKTVKKRLKRKKIWSVADEDLLLDLWAEKIEELRGPKKNKLIYQEMADEMQKWCKIFTPEEIQVKLHNLTNKYKREKLQIECNGECDWPPFQKIHTILGGFKVSIDEVLIEESIEQVPFESDYTFSEIATMPSIPPSPARSEAASSSETSGNSRQAAKRRKKETIIDNILQEYKKTNLTIIEERNHVRKVDYEMINIERERNAILKEFVMNAKVFQDNVTQMLKKVN